MNKFKGIGLLELMLALAIISVLLVAATRYFASTDSSRKVNDAANMLQAVINASEDVRTSGNSYAAITSIDILQQRGLVPENWIAKSTPNPWGGEITVDGTAGTSITLTLTNVPQTDCKSLSDFMVKKGVNGSCGAGAITIYTGTYSS